MTEPLTTEETDAMEARCNAATPGPWVVHNPDDSVCMNMLCIQHQGNSEPKDETDLEDCIAVTLLQTPVRIGGFSTPWDDNSEFIANARSDIPRLLAEVRMLRRAMLEGDKRILNAGMRVGIIGGCDTADDMADEIESLRERVSDPDGVMLQLGMDVETERKIRRYVSFVLTGNVDSDVQVAADMANAEIAELKSKLSQANAAKNQLQQELYTRPER